MAILSFRWGRDTTTHRNLHPRSPIQGYCLSTLEMSRVNDDGVLVSAADMWKRLAVSLVLDFWQVSGNASRTFTLCLFMHPSCHLWAKRECCSTQAATVMLFWIFTNDLPKLDDCVFFFSVHADKLFLREDKSRTNLCKLFAETFVCKSLHLVRCRNGGVDDSRNLFCLRCTNETLLTLMF